MLFAYPFLLLALLGLPIAYRLMRALPGGERVVPFAATMFLVNHQGPVSQVTRIPLWLVVLRLALLACLIVFAAGPRMPSDGAAAGPVFMVVDTSWSADLPSTLQDIDAFFQQYPSADAQIMTTADQTPQPMTAARWPTYRRMLSLQPYHEEKNIEISKINNSNREVIYYAPMRLGALQQDFLQRLRQQQSATVVLPQRRACALIRDVSETPSGLSVGLNNTCLTPVKAFLQNVMTGEIVAQGETAGSTITFPPVSRGVGPSIIVLIGHDHLGGRWLLSAGKTGTVGVLSGVTNPKGLLEESTYITKALMQSGQPVQAGPFVTLKDRDITTWIIPDAMVLDPQTVTTLREKIEAGAVVIRFWGPRLDALSSQERDDLFPDSPRFRARQLGTTLSWQGALKSRPLDLPLRGEGSDIVLTRQILPESGGAQVLATLSDQTPWITARAMGAGQVILIHTGLMPDFSNLATSRAFVPLLTSLSALNPSQGGGIIQKTGSLPLVQTLHPDGSLRVGGDGFLSPADQGTRPTMDHPAGLYGQGKTLTAHNLAPFIAEDRDVATTLKSSDGSLSVRQSSQTMEQGDMRPLLLTIILLLFLADVAAVLALRRWRALAMAMVAMILLASPVQAAEGIKIGYVLTGQTTVDQTSERALKTLIQETLIRTNMPMDPDPVAVGLTAKATTFAPLMMVYWPLSGNVEINAATAENLRSYVLHDGLLVIDTRAGKNPLRHRAEVQALKPLTAVLGLSPLQPIAQKHVVHHSYYLLSHLAGLWPNLPAHGALLQGQEEPVFGMVVLGADLAGGLLSPEAQVQEMSIRTGINLLMYAATTTYKDDQVHINAMMERLRP